MQLIPRDEKFYVLFNEQAENIHKAATLLVALFENYHEIEKQVAEIKFLEHHGDQLTHNLMRKLNGTFITPFDREDIHALGSALDDVLDLVEAAASRFITYKIKKVTPGAQQLAKVILRGTGIIVNAVASSSTAPLTTACPSALNNRASRAAVSKACRPGSFSRLI